MPIPFRFPWRTRGSLTTRGGPEKASLAPVYGTGCSHTGDGHPAHDNRSVPRHAAHECTAVQSTNGDRARVGDGSDERDERSHQCNALQPGVLDANNVFAHSANDDRAKPRHRDIARVDGGAETVGSSSLALRGSNDTDSKPERHRFRTGAKPEPAPGPRQYATLAFEHNGAQKIIPAATQARQYLDWLQTNAEQVLLHHEMLGSYNEFALVNQIEPVPWNALARHLNDLLVQPGQPRKPSVYRPVWPTTTRKRVRVYIIPPR